MRVALCGAGSAATRAHLPALATSELRSSIVVVGICDHEVDRARSAVTHLADVQPFSNLAAMLDRTAPDLLIIATPPTAHAEAISAAVERGIHVLCEKPVGLNRAEIALLEQLAAGHPEALIATVLQYRHAPTWQRFRDAIAAAPEDSGPVRLAISVERPGTDPLSSGGWRTEPLVQGGILGDHAVHYLGLCWGIDPGVSVTSCRRWGEGASERAALTLALAGGTAEIDVSYQGLRRRNVISLEMPANHPTLRWENDQLLGNQGRRRVEALSDRRAVNDLYAALYRELVSNMDDILWRAERSAETIGVARLLATSLETARAGLAGCRVP